MTISFSTTGVLSARVTVSCLLGGRGEEGKGLGRGEKGKGERTNFSSNSQVTGEDCPSSDSKTTEEKVSSAAFMVKLLRVSKKWT